MPRKGPERLCARTCSMCPWTQLPPQRLGLLWRYTRHTCLYLGGEAWRGPETNSGDRARPAGTQELEGQWVVCLSPMKHTGSEGPSPSVTEKCVSSILKWDRTGSWCSGSASRAASVGVLRVNRQVVALEQEL